MAHPWGTGFRFEKQRINSAMTHIRPLVGLPADTYEKSGFLYHSLGDKYVRALVDVSDVEAVMIPNLIDADNLDGMLHHFDGVLMTGAVSNVHPPHYGEQPSEDHEPYDHHRDALTLKLIRRVIDRGIPLFCICRGFQELNVAMGGTLETELQRGEGRLDHRAPDVDDIDVRYAPTHSIAVKGGLLQHLLGKKETKVNSIHRQGIKKLGDGLEVEAVAPDGVIEAVSVKGAKAFAFATQWHPEFKAKHNPDSVRLFTAFGDAVRAHRRARTETHYERRSA
jgi:putative glutamine amidotransferase